MLHWWRGELLTWLLLPLPRTSCSNNVVGPHGTSSSRSPCRKLARGLKGAGLLDVMLHRVRVEAQSHGVAAVASCLDQGTVSNDHDPAPSCPLPPSGLKGSDDALPVGLLQRGEARSHLGLRAAG